MANIVLFLVFIATAHASAWWGPSKHSLRVKFGLNVFDSLSFAHMPRTVGEATEDTHWYKLSSCDDNAAWRGNRYVTTIDGKVDFSVILLFDVNGFIAGIQTSIPDKGPDAYPKASMQPPFVKDGNRWVATAYFVEPSTICSTGRTQEDFDQSGTGHGLWVQHTAIPEESMRIPDNEEDIQAPWTKGKCFVLMMGQHYWWKAAVDQDCDKTLPFFLLYNGGVLNSFGFAMTTDAESPRFEHPTVAQLANVFQVVPTCLKESAARSSLHIYFDNPYNNWC